MLLSMSFSKVNLAERIVHVEPIKAEVSILMLQIMRKAELLQNSVGCTYLLLIYCMVKVNRLCSRLVMGFISQFLTFSI